LLKRPLQDWQSVFDLGFFQVLVLLAAMASFRVHLLGRAGMASFASSAGTAVPKAGQVGPRPGDLVPSLAALIPSIPVNKSARASQMSWVQSSESFFETWKKLSPCMPKYAEFIALHKAEGLTSGKGFQHDLKLARQSQDGKVASREAGEAGLVALGKFYLHVALQLRPQEVEEAGSDATALMKLAQKCAEEDFEPFVENARELVSDYDASLHKALEETSPWYEVDDGLFWQANFDVAAPAAFLHFLTAVGHGSGQGRVEGKTHVSPDQMARQVELVREGLHSNDQAFEPARIAAEMVYTKWLEASSMPVKGDIKKILSEHGLIVSQELHDANTLMPEPIPAVMHERVAMS